MKFTILLLLLTIGLYAGAQQNIFTEDELVDLVMKFHPVAKQAAIDVKIAKAEILSRKGSFDPQLTIETSRKEFGGLTYYDNRTSEIIVPSWYGMDFFAGKEKITGSRINPEETQGAITYMGFSIQPLQNLLIDKRRAALLQAKNFLHLSETERRIAVNDLLQEALYSYWDWWEKFHVQQLMKSAVVNAEKRMALVKSGFQLGDRAAIDTLEAYTQVQVFQIRLSEAFQELMKANFQLSAFLWTERGEQTQLPFDVIPEDYKQERAFTLADVLSISNLHPELTQYEFKFRGLQIDKKLAFQSLLPQVKAKYNQTGYDLAKTVNAPWFNNNYRFGLSVYMPLRLSEGRGDYKKAKLKLERAQIEQLNKQVQLSTKVKQYYTEWQQTEMQLSIQRNLLANTTALQRGEEVRFANGESSLFLINAREQKTIEAELKVIELKAKAQKAAVGVRWSAGMFAL